MVVLNVQVNNCTPVTIALGMRGTYNTREVVFDLTNLVQTYGSGTAVLLLKRSQDSNAYPAVVSQDGNTLTWIVAEADTYYYGPGECQLMWYTDEGLAKTVAYPTIVTRDIAQTTEEPPESYETWIGQLTELGAQTQQNAEDAQAASQAIQNMSVEANGVAYDQPASVEKTVDPDTGAVTLTFDIPAGTPGGGGGGLVDSVNGKTGTVVLTAEDVGAMPDTYQAPVSSVAGKTGAVTLGAGDVGYDGQATYAAGSVGHEVSELSRQLSDLDDDKQDAPSTAGTAGQVLALDDNLNPVWANQSSGGVSSVNGKTGAVTLNASDVGAGTYSKPSGGIPASDLASAVQASLGKADSAYQKPVGGIPATDLASAVQTSLGKADTALQSAPVSSVAGKTGAVSLDAGDVEFDDTETYAAGSIGAEVSQQKNAIDQKQDATNYVTLSGTIVTQTGADNTMYLCGELAELTFTAPATGQTAIRFSSGTTPTVATFSGVTWLNGFDPSAIEASKTYEVNILNGLGCAAWT